MASGMCIMLWGFIFLGFANTAQAARLTINLVENKPPKDSVTIACMATDIGDSAREVDIIQILKEYPDSKQKMVLHIDQIRNQVMHDHDSKERLKGNGVGKIDTSTPADSFLSLTFDDPKPVDEGQYICEVYFKNEEGELQHTVSTGTVILPKKPVPAKPEVSKADLENLQKQMQALKDTMYKQETDHLLKYAQQQKTIKELKSNLQIKDNQIAEINKKDFVSQDHLNGVLIELKLSLTHEVTQLKDALEDARKDLQNKLEGRDKDQDADLASHVRTFEKVTKTLADKNTVMDIDSRVQSSEVVIEDFTKKISLLSDRVKALDFLVQAFLQEPATTAKPTKDPLNDVVSKVNSLESQSLNQTRHIAYLMDKDSKASVEISDLNNLTDTLSSAVSSLAFEAKNKEANITAFSAMLVKQFSASVNTPIVFDDVQLNKGQAYDKSTGVFTAPRAGIYAFHLVLLVKIQDELIDIDLKANKVTLIRLTSKEKDREDQGSVSVVTQLKAGDQVRAVVNYTSKSIPTNLSNAKLSAFSGYIIQPL